MRKVSGMERTVYAGSRRRWITERSAVKNLQLVASEKMSILVPEKIPVISCDLFFMERTRKNIIYLALVRFDSRVGSPVPGKRKIKFIKLIFMSKFVPGNRNCTNAVDRWILRYIIYNISVKSFCLSLLLSIFIRKEDKTVKSFTEDVKYEKPEPRH
jgi:hypothetical protein